mmetsp:Transcript_23061/g.67135  ORF Transcript_23061/g.67135 Transcript_23061/m.67135 type:complete len:268 (+) Transcript_23061:406-1209(+)
MVSTATCPPTRTAGGRSGLSSHKRAAACAWPILAHACRFKLMLTWMRSLTSAMSVINDIAAPSLAQPIPTSPVPAPTSTTRRPARSLSFSSRKYWSRTSAASHTLPPMPRCPGDSATMISMPATAMRLQLWAPIFCCNPLSSLSQSDSSVSPEVTSSLPRGFHDGFPDGFTRRNGRDKTGITGRPCTAPSSGPSSTMTFTGCAVVEVTSGRSSETSWSVKSARPSAGIPKHTQPPMTSSTVTRQISWPLGWSNWRTMRRRAEQAFAP